MVAKWCCWSCRVSLSPFEQHDLSAVGTDCSAIPTYMVPQNNRPGSWEPFATAEPCGPVRLSVGVPAVTERTRQDGRTWIASAHAPTLRATQRAPAAAAGHTLTYTRGEGVRRWGNRPL